MNRYDLIILGLLEDKPQHGYDIKTFVETNKLNQWANVSVSSLYNRLSWLSKNEYIDGSFEQVGNRPMRNNFQITGKGKDLLHGEIMDFIGGFNDDPRTLGLSFLHVLPNDIADEAIAKHIDYLEKEVVKQKKIIREKKQNASLLHELSPLLSNMSLDHIRVELKYMRAVHDVLINKKASKKLIEIFDINT